jgi:hypothetical protein
LSPAPSISVGQTSLAKQAKIDKAVFLNATPKVQRIVTEDVIPLMVRGYKLRQISEQLGVDERDTEHYMLLAYNHWKTSAADMVTEWRGRVFSNYAEICRSLWEAFEESKVNNKVVTVTENADGSKATTTKTSPPDLRWLSALVAVNKEISAIVGLKAEAPVISVQPVDESVRHSLAPLSTDAWAQMLQAQGGSLSVTVQPPMASAVDTTAAPVETIDAVAD